MDALERLWQRGSSPDGEAGPPARRRTAATRRVLLAAAAVLVLFILLNVGKGFYTEWLWFKDLGYGAVYTTILRTKALVFVVAAVLFCLLFLGNVVLATRLAPRSGDRLWPWPVVSQLQRVTRWSTVVGTILVSLIFGIVAQDNWLVVLRLLNAQPFGINDPVFNKEIAFYVFSLPFLRLLHGWLMGAFIVTLIGTASVYALSYAVQRARFDFARPVLIHIGALVIAILGLFAWAYRLGMWEVVFSKRGVVFGAS